MPSYATERRSYRDHRFCDGSQNLLALLHCHPSFADMLSATAHCLTGTSYRSLNSSNSFKSSFKNRSVCSSLISTVLLPPSDYPCLRRVVRRLTFLRVITLARSGNLLLWPALPETSTTSPGTRSRALICCTPRWPWRITFAISGSYSFSASIALSAFRSCNKRQVTHHHHHHQDQLTAGSALPSHSVTTTTTTGWLSSRVVSVLAQ